jgi:hypothetical protein
MKKINNIIYEEVSLLLLENNNLAQPYKFVGEYQENNKKRFKYTINMDNDEIIHINIFLRNEGSEKPEFLIGFASEINGGERNDKTSTNTFNHFKILATLEVIIENLVNDYNNKHDINIKYLSFIPNKERGIDDFRRMNFYLRAFSRKLPNSRVRRIPVGLGGRKDMVKVELY